LVEKGIETVDEAPVFLALAITSGVSMVLVWISRVYGPRWRQARLKRIKMQQEQAAQQASS
jgi:Ni/Fe-hydrogenase subunit HybB-like protein